MDRFKINTGQWDHIPIAMATKKSTQAVFGGDKRLRLSVGSVET